MKGRGIFSRAIAKVQHEETEKKRVALEAKLQEIEEKNAELERKQAEEYMSQHDKNAANARLQAE